MTEANTTRNNEDTEDGVAKKIDQMIQFLAQICSILKANEAKADLI